MEVFRGIKELDRSLPHAVVTIGNFDGVHLGHQEILRIAREQAAERSGTVVAYTFKPHPQIALRPAQKTQLLTTYPEKLELLHRYGADVVIEEPFSRDFSNTTAQQFFSDNLLHRISAEAVVVGYDFSFGKGREGHLEELERLSQQAGIRLTVVPPLRVGSEIVSSTGIRRALFEGRAGDARDLLGYPFFYRGVVIRGEQRGRKLGFPTANLRIEEKLTLPYGVYATIAMYEGREYPSVTNVGVRPTFQVEELEALVETHLFALPGPVGGPVPEDTDLYGRTLEVRFVRKLRDERKFGGVGALKEQIARDVDEARAVLK
jgi:riboflavin kinase/FMN adenylyltransferase